MSTTDSFIGNVNLNPSDNGVPSSIVIPIAEERRGLGPNGNGRSSLPPASQADPADVADLVVAELTSDGVSRLRYWASSWWYWSAGRYTELTADQVRSLVTNVFKARWSVVRSKHVTDVIEHLRAKVSLGSGISPPAWIEQAVDGWDPADCLATRDSIVHLPSLVEGIEPSIIPATPRFFTTVATEFGFDGSLTESGIGRDKTPIGQR